jgi:MFS family permease
MVPLSERETSHGGYLSELRVNGRALTAACIGMGAGFLLNHYVANIFTPHLLDEFGWAKADFALIGTLGLLSLFIVPIVGRLTDMMGVRRVALVGVTAFPLTFVAYSMMPGSLEMFAVITVAQNLLAGATTSSTVYSRLIAERFVSARGLALAIAATIPALIGVVASPLLQGIIDAHGWRTGYLVVAGYTAIMGGIALAIVPSADPGQTGAMARPRRRAAEDYPEILRTPAFWVIICGMLLCNLIYPLQSSQMKLMLMESGASSALAAFMISLLAGGVVLGRFIFGLALDRFPTHLVAAIAMSLPAAGLFALAAGLDAPVVLAGSVVLVGLSLGAESDLAAYMVIRYFRIEVYGTVLGLVVTSMAVSAALGAIVLSVTLSLIDNFRLYMLLVGVASAIGGLQFLLLGRRAMQPGIASGTVR